jgi:uncharacterized Fe-S cluster-containing radical SAM superfamily protein
MYDPIELAERTRKIVERNGERKYYRFRAAQFYGGIATADCVGCNLRCLFCWAWNVVHDPEHYGKFYTPDTVAERLLDIASKKGFVKARISGNEPTLCKEHLFSVLEKTKIPFILETNGILIGYDKGFAAELSQFKNVHVRVSLKGSSESEFTLLTGAKPDAYKYQIRALKNLFDSNVSFHPAIMTFEKSPFILERLAEIDESLLKSLEYESLIPYPKVVARLRAVGIKI